MLRLLCVQVFCLPTPRGSTNAPLPWAPVAGQVGVGTSLKGLVKARQSGRTEARAEHWWEWVQRPKTKTPTGAWLLLRLRLQRGKRHCSCGSMWFSSMQRCWWWWGRRGRNGGGCGVTHDQSSWTHGGTVGLQTEWNKAQQMRKVHVSSTQRLSNDNGTLGHEGVPAKVIRQSRRRFHTLLIGRSCWVGVGWGWRRN